MPLEALEMALWQRGGALPEQAEFATLEYRVWWNNRCLHTENREIPPAEKEEMYYAGQELNAKADWRS
jgi:hypothetical protein